MSDLIPAASGTATKPPRSLSEQKVEQITALLAKLQPPSPEPQAARPAEASVDKPAAVEAAPDAAKPDEPKAETAPAVQRDPILELLDRLHVASASFGERDNGLAMGINKLVERASQPGVAEQAGFRTHVAYMLQDTEKALGAGRVAVSPELKAEMSRLADTSPGLENKAMRALLASTREIDDRAGRDLRRAAASMVTMGPAQNDPKVNQVVETLENRVRLARHVGPSAEVAETTIVADKSGSAQLVARETQDNAAPIPSTGSPSPEGDTNFRNEPRLSASPGDNAQRQRPSDAGPKQDPVDAAVVSQKLQPKTAMAQIMDNLRPSAPAAPPPWNPPAVRMSERVSRFQQVLDQGKTDQLIQASEKSGVALMKSIETFANGPGAAVLGKIETAAKTEPGGAKTVMQEMQPGGRYAALRTEFDNALQSDRVFAAAYNQVEKTGAQYSKDRLALNADFDAKRLYVRQLDARFQHADEAIGETAERIPGRTPGKSVMDELGHRVAEMIGRAVQRVRSMFGRDAVPDPQPSASPSMAP